MGSGKLFPGNKEDQQSELIDFIENELELATFKLIDPHYVDTIEDLVDRVHTIRHKERRFGAGCVERWRENKVELRKEADRLLNRFCESLQSSEYLLGVQPVYADFALFGVIGNMTYKGFNELSESQAALSQWRARLDAFRY